MSKLAAAAALPSAFVFTVVLVGDLLYLVGAFTDLFALEVRTAPAVKGLFCKKSTLAAAASISAPAFPSGSCWRLRFFVGAFADLSSLMAGPAAAFTGLSCLMRWVPAAASILALALSVTSVEFAVLVGIFEFVGLVGVLSVPSVYFCLPGGRPPKEEKVFYVPIFSTSLKQSCQVDCYRVLVQGSGEHGAVGGLPAGMVQASGRVDVPDGTKIEAAAAFAGTLRSRPGSCVPTCAQGSSIPVMENAVLGVF